MDGALSFNFPDAAAGGTGPAGAQARPDDETTRLFEQAVQDHSRRLHAIARAIVGHRAGPEDVVQQAVLNLYRHRYRYDWSTPGGLLKRATVNEALRILRRPPMSSIVDYQPDAGAARPESAMLTDETVARVRAAIEQLPPHFRSALVLCEYEGMSYAEIAQTLDASIPQVKTWLHRARKKLAGLLEGYVRPDEE